MSTRFSRFIFCLLLILSMAPWGCSSVLVIDEPNSNQVVFNPVGTSFGSSDLVDLEFLPGQNGEAIVIGLGGRVYYMKKDFTPLSANVLIPVASGSEQGLLNVVADPDYASNQFVYFYYTVPGTTPIINRVERRTVSVNTVMGTFALNDPQTIIEFDKSQSPSSGAAHNGGSMVFDLDGNLLIGVGDGGGAGSTDQTLQIAQDLEVRLGKIHRIVPSRMPGVGGFSNPIPANGVSNSETSIYALGARNPFTAVIDEDGDLFFGDVGNNFFEEINCVYHAGENYGWPLCEGPCQPFNPAFRDPTHGYQHGDQTFNDEDPEENPDSGESIMVSAFYRGTAYQGQFTDKLIYNEFFAGWVRLLTLDNFDQVIEDHHIGHLEGMTSLQENPADGLLYAVSLFQSDHILRMELVP